MWLYGVLNPAYAYSFHWFAIFSLFIGGYFFLLRQFGANSVMAALLSFGLYFTGFSQFWWNEKGPIIAIFPWVIMPFLLKMRWQWQLAWFYYAAVFWLLTNFYPPVQISLAFVGLVVLLAKKPRMFTRPILLGVLLAAALAAGTAALYLWDYLAATSATIYPGSRNSVGGSVTGRYVLSWFFPSINFSWVYNSLIGLNICEIGTVGMYYFTAVFIFLNYRNVPALWREASVRNVFLVLLLGFLVQLAWMVLPVPSAFGKLLLWNHVEPARMQYASGVLLTLLVMYIANAVGLVFSWQRLCLVAVLVIGTWVVFKSPFGTRRAEDLFFLLVLLGVYVWVRKRPHLSHEGIALASLIFGLVLFGRFNPLQSAWPIFNLQPNEVVRYLQEREKNNGGVLAFPGLPGSIANGLGLRSLSHTTAVPQMAFWQKSFPGLPDNELNAIFNRYSHVVPDLILRPRLQHADGVLVPLDHFTPLNASRVVEGHEPDLRQAGGYSIESQHPGELLLSGWADWSSGPDTHGMEIISSPPISGETQLVPLVRPDLLVNTGQRVSALNGFKLLIPAADKTLPNCLSLVAVDKKTGDRSLLNNPPALPYCTSSSTR